MSISLELKMLYRGPLASCNYDCVYCPFAKQKDSAQELKVDRIALERFCQWVELRAEAESRFETYSVLFTPWGEALTRRWYRDALVRLSNLPHVSKVAIQTNLACGLEWVKRCELKSIGLWCTWHPTQVPMETFLARCQQLDQIGAPYSVGLVGLHEHAEAAGILRQQLSPDVYFWINAYKRDVDYYSQSDIEYWKSIDPLFDLNNTRHASFGKSCRSGESVISVDGQGDVRRCHFIKQVIGNIYQPEFEDSLCARVCTNQTCGCHIGYVHLNELKLYDVFADGVMERIPKNKVWQSELVVGSNAQAAKI